MLRQLARLLPLGARQYLWRVYHALRIANTTPEMPYNTTSFDPEAIPGPLVRDVFDHIKKMPGWFNIDDCTHFFLILSYQRALGITGDILEIGSFHGRSTCLLGYCLQKSEKLVVCDTFELPGDEAYQMPPTPENLIDNVLSVNPDLPLDRLDIRECLSTDLKFEPGQRFRFAHVDGGHSKDIALADLRLCAKHMLPGGVIAVDDHEHPVFPGVTEAIVDFMSQNSEFQVLADLNRHGAKGRKLYLVRK